MAGLYIHIPFCHSKCAYCDFFSTPKSKDSADYVDALIGELDRRKGEIDSPFTTVYIGGGTPSSLDTSLLDRLFTRLPADAEEFTIEVNPEDVTDEFARWLSDSPVNRVSMGIQSLCDDELKAVGRRHSAADALAAYQRLRNAGIANISLDLIFGLPGQTAVSWLTSLEGVIALRPEHLSAYTLMLEPGTRLYAMAKAGKFVPSDDALIESMYDSLCRATADAGYRHYEISNFALPGFHSRHNSSYWDMTPYLGLGTGAHSFDGKVRRFNPADIKGYIASGGDITRVDPETPTEVTNDMIMTRMRTAEGLDLDQLRGRVDSEDFKEIMRQVRRHVNLGNLTITDNRIAIPEKRFIMADSIIVDLIL